MSAKSKTKKKRAPASGDVATNRRARQKFEMIEKINLFDVSSSFSMETIKYTTALPVDYIE